MHSTCNERVSLIKKRAFSDVVPLDPWASLSSPESSVLGSLSCLDIYHHHDNIRESLASVQHNRISSLVRTGWVALWRLWVRRDYLVRRYFADFSNSEAVGKLVLFLSEDQRTSHHLIDHILSYPIVIFPPPLHPPPDLSASLHPNILCRTISC